MYFCIHKKKRFTLKVGSLVRSWKLRNILYKSRIIVQVYVVKGSSFHSESEFENSKRYHYNNVPYFFLQKPVSRGYSAKATFSAARG